MPEKSNVEGVIIILLGTFIVILTVLASGALYFFNERAKSKEKALLLATEHSFIELKETFHEERQKDLTKADSVMQVYVRLMEKISLAEPRKKRSTPYIRVDTRGLSDVQAAVVEGIAYLPYIEKTYGELIDRVIVKYGFEVDRDLILAHIAIESKGNRFAISDSGAIGVMQIMQETAIGFGIKPRRLVDPYWNLYCGIRHIHEAVRQEHINSEARLIVSYWAGYHKSERKRIGVFYAENKYGQGSSENVPYYQKVYGVLEHIRGERQVRELIYEQPEPISEPQLQTVAMDEEPFM